VHTVCTVLGNKQCGASEGSVTSLQVTDGYGARRSRRHSRQGGFDKTVDEVARQCDVFDGDCPVMPGILSSRTVSFYGPRSSNGPILHACCASSSLWGTTLPLCETESEYVFALQVEWCGVRVDAVAREIPQTLLRLTPFPPSRSIRHSPTRRVHRQH
jgi:hypothetical protein